MKLIRTFPFTLLLTASFAFAQSGDKAGEEQKSLVPAKLIPPAPVLTPEQAMKSFKLQKGFRLELVAAEPLVQDPVQIAFDADGRIWVVEMTGYMPNVDGKGEDAPVGRIVILEDTDGDGDMDKRTIFLDGLVMPRALCLVRDGALIAEPPKLWFCRDTDGDGKCDDKTLVAENYAKEADPRLGLRMNPEHAANTLMPAMDNWIYSANFTTKYRYDGEAWTKAPAAFRGQWGLSQDNYGRFVYDSNSDQFRIDLVPSEYLVRNPYLRGAAGLQWKPVADQVVWPIRPNPGVNRGYRKGQLRDTDWSLATFTAAAGPVVYRGDNFPSDCVNNEFVPEPSGNMIRRNKTSEKDGYVFATNAYDKAEFIASTDERFRPINLNNGPDGALYIVDLYRGIIQHRVFVTSYLRQQILSRDLDKGIHLGRLWRVVAEDRPLNHAPKLGKASPEELVRALSHPNGWTRDTAQRLLVERNPAAALPLLKQLVTKGREPLGRLHALWTLDGIGQFDATTALQVFNGEKHSKVLATAIRVSEPALKGEAKAQLLPKLTGFAEDKRVDVRLQLAFTLGQVIDPQAEAAMAKIAFVSGTNALVRDALISGLAGREDEMLARLLADKNWATKRPGLDQFITGLAKCVATRAKGEDVNKVLEVAASPHAASWQTAAVLGGLAANAPGSSASKSKGKSGQSAPRVKYIRVASEPPALAALRKLTDKQVKSDLAKLDRVLVWAGKPGAPPPPVIRALSERQHARLEAGRQLYEATCGACHQPHGFGQEGLAPPLADSEWVAGKDVVLARIVLHGVHGPISVLGRKFDLDMPSFDSLDDEQLASILTYIRREWDHTFDPVEPATVAKVRAATKTRGEAWTEAELKKVK
ncbi:MAG TPA: c-type cytochrome [Verrucomicrobiae bacterium]|jgi:mono/diheme cytochrome c family protein/glucose/arabinose dehydrogenase